jgi:D-glycero-D-manno-heptose 1,7-bisphosphate phosphatase
VRRAVFLDRDGTLIELVHHLADPAKVRLLPRAAAAVRALRDEGYACVLVTNQSAVGRGLLTLGGLRDVHAELERQLREEGTELDGFYFCPVEPEQDDPTVIEHPDRKPGPGMLLRAASELELDLGRSWMIGDTLSDLLAGRNAGCLGTVLVRTGYGQKLGDHRGAADHVSEDLWAATELVLTLDRDENKG